MFLKNKNIIFKIKRSKVTDYAALTESISPQEKSPAHPLEELDRNGEMIKKMRALDISSLKHSAIAPVKF